MSCGFFESKKKTRKYENRHDALAAKVVNTLMQGLKAETFSNIELFELFKSFHLQKNEKLMQALRKAFQRGLIDQYRLLLENNNPEENRDATELYISNYLSLMSIAEIEHLKIIKVPQYINNQWTLIEYHVEPIELTKPTGIERLWMTDKDKVYAYGLRPVVSEDALPWLVYKGTTVMTGDGFVAQLNSDIKPFQTPGEDLYLSGRDRIIQWIDKQQKKVRVCGASLGGSMALITAADLGVKLARVDAQNPAGLNTVVKGLEYDHWDRIAIEDKPKVFVQKQKNDWVTRFGIWKDDWIIIDVNLPKGQRPGLSLLSHILNYAGFENPKFSIENPSKDNDDELRQWSNILIYTALRIILNAMWLPVYVVVLPAMRYMAEHPVKSTLFALGAIVLPQLTMFDTALRLTLALLATTPVMLDLSKQLINAFSSETTEEVAIKIDDEMDFSSDDEKCSPVSASLA